jgi:hypothetical protein
MFANAWHQASGGFFRFAVDFFDRRLQRADDERQPDKRQGRSQFRAAKRGFDSEWFEYWPIQPFWSTRL